MQDIEYFSKEKLSKVWFRYSSFDAPPELKKTFLSFYPYNVFFGVLQDYKKTSENGLDEVKFWYGASKYILLLSPAFFGATRGFSKATGLSEWKHLYFDSLTGKILSAEREEAADKLHQIGLEHLNQNELNLAIHYFEMATRNTVSTSSEKASSYMISQAIAYYQSRCFKKAIEKANEAIKFSNNAANAQAEDTRNNSQIKLDAYQHYAKGREILVQALQTAAVQPSEQSDQAIESKGTEAELEFSQACKLDDSNPEYQSARKIAQRSREIKLRKEDLQLADASELFALAVNFKNVGNLEQAQLEFTEAEQIFKLVESNLKNLPSDEGERLRELIQQFRYDIQKPIITSAGTTASLPAQTVESFEYDRSYFSLLCRLKAIWRL